MTIMRSTPSVTAQPSTYRTRSPFGALDRFGAMPALVTDGSSITYADLARRVRERARVLGARRRLVVLECRNDVETVVTYLSALEGHHPVLLVGPGGLADGLAETYRPDVVASGAQLDVRDPAGHELHPDLAVLLSTSGSTGSPKLVRLSHENLRSNAESVASYLALRADDRAATTLPLHYCYGLSVLNSHLVVGASLLLTEASVLDEHLWVDFAAAGCTSFAGVPHSFDLLTTSGFEQRELPTLRTVTQAGGRLDPTSVRQYARLGRERGFEFVVMYGQTEATARMAYLPPHLAAERPESIGVPVPGGHFRIDGDGEVGELVYSGANVMLGYAQGPEDLALGRTVTELRTGDLARQDREGLFEIVGRSSRFAKVFGLRIDLDRVESSARQTGLVARAVEYDNRLHLFVTRHRDTDAARDVIRSLDLPSHAAEVHVVDALPLTPSGKPDHTTLTRHAAVVTRDRVQECTTVDPTRVTAARIRDVYAHLLGRSDATEDDSFVTLRGDSLSYVETSVRLGQMIPDLPLDWAQLSARRLAATARPVERRHRWWAQVETTVVLRALAIVLIVATHANLLTVVGGAHVLLALVGFNLARFQLSGVSRCERRRGLLRAARNVAVPAGLWIAGVGLVTGMYDASTALMLNNLLGSETWDVRWQFWFLEVVVWALAGVAVVLPLAAVDRFERTHPFGFAATVFTVALGARYAIAGLEGGPTERYALPAVLWCVALGWMAARARTRGHRVLTTLAAVAASWGFFGDPVREMLVAGGVCVLVWVPRLPVLRPALPVLSALAASSLFIYLTHWQVYPHLEMEHPWLATFSSLVVGVFVWRGHDLVAGVVHRLSRPGSQVPRVCAVVAPGRSGYSGGHG